MKKEEIIKVLINNNLVAHEKDVIACKDEGEDFASFDERLISAVFWCYTDDGCKKTRLLKNVMFYVNEKGEMNSLQHGTYYQEEV